MRTTPSRFRTYHGAARIENAVETTGGGGPGSQASESLLEQRHPAVMRTIALLWGHPELNQYFVKLSSGIDPTLNLEPEAMAEAMLLSAVHQRICPYTPAKSVEEVYGRGPWDGAWKPARPRR